MSYLDQLSTSQRDAVACTEGPLMIIAGAGSGKTRAITCRIASLLKKGVQPFHILTLTFTNKAAKSMCERMFPLAGAGVQQLWMGTFHSIFARILRIEAGKLRYPSNFTIYDTEDSKSLLRSLIKEQGLDDQLYKPSIVLNRISSAKNNLFSADDYQQDISIKADDDADRRPAIGKLYQLYSQRCLQAGAMDFDDLLFNTNVLLKSHPDVLQKYQQQFKYILVDEYQDTNYSQYLIVKSLAAAHRNLCVVGDDAQSIYSFRGANIGNILNFKNDYPELHVFKLEQNYRSTKNIVGLANSIISKNKDQLQKNSFSQKEAGEKIQIIRSLSDREEALAVAQSIQEQHQKGLPYSAFVVLYRTNAQSRSLEEGLRNRGVPYKVYGGLSFYQRKEVKDLIAYCRLSVNPFDEEALKRVINYPKRNIGDTSLKKMMTLANEQQVSLWEIVSNLNASQGRSAASIVAFVDLIKSFMALHESMDAYQAAQYIAVQSGLLPALIADQTVEGVNRHDNVQELLNGIKEFSEREDLPACNLPAFLEEVVLLTGDAGSEKDTEQNHVSLMTIHASKGLEFPHVYVVGMEEKLFPSERALYSMTELEEERRLLYVAITRAEEKLTLSYATSRYQYGMLHKQQRSRFMDEMDKCYLDLPPDMSAQTAVNRNRQPQFINQTAEAKGNLVKNTDLLPQAHQASPNFLPDDTKNLQVGTQVEHVRFGFGTVLQLEGRYPEVKATIFFQSLGNKQLLLKFAKLRIVN